MLPGVTACTGVGTATTTARVLSGSASPQTQTPQPTYASTIIPTITPSLVEDGATPWVAATAPFINTPSERIINQNLSVNPPPPSEVMAVWDAQGVQLSWEMPPVVSVPHNYQNEILYYKIYRHTKETQIVFLAQTTQQTYLDRNVVVGITYYYTISAFHAGEVESLRAEEVSAP